MNNRNTQKYEMSEQSDFTDVPFVCLNKPFVGLSNPIIRPFVDLKHPFVGIRKISGFTLIELAITLAVAAIIAAVAIPNFQTFIKNNRLNTRTSEIVSSLQLARSEAAKQKTRVTICTSTSGTACTAGTNWHQGWIVWTEKGGAVGIDAGDPLNEILKTESDSDPTMTINSAEDTMDYLPDGTAITPGGGAMQFTLCDDRTAEVGRQITIALTGRANSETFVCL